MSISTFLIVLSFAQLSSSQEVNQANIPFYSLIFSERFPPTMSKFYPVLCYSCYKYWFLSPDPGGRSTLEAQDIRTNEINLETKEKKYLPSVFIPAKNKGLLKIESKKEEVKPSTFQQVMGIANNLKMALYDCKIL